MSSYQPNEIEKKWQRAWVDMRANETPDHVEGRPNKMVLVEFPYPSGNLHIGHWYAFALPDMYARYWKMKGFNVLYPMGFDAFGLPAENAALQRDIHPGEWTKQNIEYMTNQLHSMGAMFDFSRAVSTIDPTYYRWTQWMFLRMFEKGLAYRAKTTVNWCPKDQTVLANEQVVDGHCERCSTAVQQRSLEQWMMKTTAYADRLISGLENLDWPNTARTAQQHWIGKSEGAIITFPLSGIAGQEDGKHSVEVFTTRPDTLFGATFLVVSPELAQKWIDVGWQASDEVRAYITESRSKRELERLEGAKDKTGVALGISAKNPISGESIPVWVADYVLGNYGTGAIMAVPAHDERDRAFADAFNLPISDAPLHDVQEVIDQLAAKGAGYAKTTFKLRDWVLSRQRYWGVPIPIIHCTTCGYVPVPDDQLPVELPPLRDFKPADDGRSPLAKATEWLSVLCPKCGEDAQRETDTMDTFVDSSWYYLRYTDPHNSEQFASKEKMAQWLPVPIYLGGSDHNTMHLLYSRFFAKVLFDLGYLSFEEPFLKRVNRGWVLGPDGQKMSKSRGNVVDPDKEVAQYGADTVRMYLAFMAPYERGGPWDPRGITGVHRLLSRIWTLFLQEPADEASPDVERALHAATRNISRDIEFLSLNTCISELMKLMNAVDDAKTTLTTKQREHIIRLLAPFAPHLAEELWHSVCGHTSSVHQEPWPSFDAALLESQSVVVPVQVNGKLRDTIEVASDASEDAVKAQALAADGVVRALEGLAVQKVIVIPKRMVSIVAR
ncbi:MAG: leucine--tRNA ligase [Patescibacteria group bacterium]|mgnify:FL=1